jgi:hypothetical protein
MIASTELGLTLDQINWLGIVVNLSFLPATLFVPPLISLLGIRRCVRLYFSIAK